jgi:hypothetical protein
MITEISRSTRKDRRNQHHGERGQRRTIVVEAGGIEEHGRGDHARRRGARNADEVALVSTAGALDVETRQAHRRARDEHEAGSPAEPAERLQSPGVGQDGGRDPERHDVRERIQLESELTFRPGQARDAAVQRVEQIRKPDERRGGFVVAAHGVHDAGVAAPHVAHGEQAGKQVDTAAVPLLRGPVGRAPEETKAPFGVVQHLRLTSAQT